MSGNLKILTAFGVLWTGISQFSTQAFQFIVIIILARLLSPGEFGIAGLATVFIGLISTVNELGLSAAIIQRKEVNDLHLSTSFWASVGMGAVLCILTILISPFIAAFFNEDQVRPILIVSSAGFLIGSFSVIHKALLEKDLNFKSITIVEVCAAFTSGIISIWLALNGWGVWSLVLGNLSGIFISVIVLWKINAWRPLLKFSTMHFKQLFGFGSRVTGSNLLNYIAASADYMIIGKFLGTSSLGYYTLAYNLVTFPLIRVSWMVMRVTFPAFSKIQESNEILSNGYLKVVKYVSLITFPMLAGMFIVAPDFVVSFYGTKWTPMIVPLQILCLAGALKSIGAIISNVLYSKGRADIQFKWQFFYAIVMPVAVVIGAKYGISGVAGAVTIMTVILAVIIQIITNKLIDLKMYSYLSEIFPAAISSLILIASVGIYQKMVPGLPLMHMLISSIFVGIVVYVILIWLLFNNLLSEMRLLINEMRG